MRNGTKAKVFVMVAVVATAMSQLVLAVSAYARWGLGCSSFLHKREVPAKLRHTYEG